MLKNHTKAPIICAVATLLCVMPISIEKSETGGVTLSVDSAQARIGRPLTPLSYAGVARRTTRRAMVGGAVVAPVVVAPGCARDVTAYGQVVTRC